MIEALLYGAISGLTLLVGALAALYYKFKQKTLAIIMAFGSGTLICALTFGLMVEAFEHGGRLAVVTGFLLGGIAFIAGDYLISLIGGRRHKRKHFLKSTNENNGAPIVLGAILDGIPESVALGITLCLSSDKGLMLAVAIAISNFPEGISSVPGLMKEGFKRWQVFLLWGFVALITFLATVLSFMFFGDLNPRYIGTVEAFAAGATLAMLADTMMPEAYEEGGFIVGLVTVLGFLLAFLISYKIT